MTGRAGVAAGAGLSLVLWGIGGLVLFAALFIVLMLVIGAVHRAWYR